LPNGQGLGQTLSARLFADTVDECKQDGGALTARQRPKCLPRELDDSSQDVSDPGFFFVDLGFFRWWANFVRQNY